MILQVCAVLDTAASCYARPVFVPTIGVMVRAFTDEVNRVGADNAMNLHPSDFILFHFGEFNDETGEFNLLAHPDRITRAVDVLQRAS